MVRFKCFSILSACLCASVIAFAQKVDYSVVSVPEEAGFELKKITSDNDMVAMPLVIRKNSGVQWVSGRVIDISPSDGSLAFISARENTTNIYVKNLNARNRASVKRTNRTAVMDLSFSPDGKYICFSEEVGKTRNIFQTDARQGFICRQITNGSEDYNPVYSKGMEKLFFSRKESMSFSIWSYDLTEKYISNYSPGLNPFIIGDSQILCSRTNSVGRGEIWLIDLEYGTEECILSDSQISFSSPVLSPDGKRLAIVGGTPLPYKDRFYWNTDIYVCNLDGSELQQVTYHAADDLCPVWDQDGKSLFFISQRGSEGAVANIWKIDF